MQNKYEVGNSEEMSKLELDNVLKNKIKYFI